MPEGWGVVSSFKERHLVIAMAQGLTSMLMPMWITTVEVMLMLALLEMTTDVAMSMLGLKETSC